MQSLSSKELENISGGMVGLGIAAVGIILAYACWAADFCYNLGKD